MTRPAKLRAGCLPGRTPLVLVLVLATAMAAVALADTHPDALAEARSALRVGDYARAAELARGATAQSEDADAWYTLGRAHRQLGDPVAAAAAWEQAVLRQPGHLPALIERLLLRQYDHDRDAALVELEALLAPRLRTDTETDSRSLQALGDAARALALRDAALFHAAVDFYQRARQRDPDNLDAGVRLGELLLSKHNNADALRTFREVLERDPAYAPALLGLARSLHFDGRRAALQRASDSVAAQPTLVAARVFLARLLLEQQQFEAAADELAAALAVNPNSLPALSMRAAHAYLTGRSAAMDEQLQALQSVAPNYTGAYALLAEVAARTRGYQDAVRFALLGLALNDEDAGAMATLGINRLRLGQMENGRHALELAFKADPFDVRVKNMLDLLDKLRGFDAHRSARFLFLAEAGRAELIAPYLLPIAEAAYDYYSARYRRQLPQPLRIEMFSDHADFSVRTVGLTGLDIIGASFGPVILLDPPSSSQPYNWASALWHEIAHSFHLAISAHRAPRWFSEGLAVYEERLARPGWGGDVSPAFLQAWREGRLRPAIDIEQAFLAPRDAEEVPHTYFLSSLLIELIETTHGLEVLLELMQTFGEQRLGMAGLAARLGYTPAAFNDWLSDYVNRRFEQPLAALRDGAFEASLGHGKRALAEGDLAQAVTRLRQAREQFPQHAGPGSAYRDLAAIYTEQGERAAAIAELEANIAIDADDLEAHLALLQLYLATEALEKAREIARRALLIQPYDGATRARLAQLHEQQGEYELAVRERRAVLALAPLDPIDARYRLAQSLLLDGQPDPARRELLQALEQAPLFEAGLELLLRLRERAGQGDRAADG